MEITVKFYLPKGLKGKKKTNIKRWKKAIEWWVKKLKKKCDGLTLKIKYEDTDTTSLPEGKTWYATENAKVKKEGKTLVGRKTLFKYLGDETDPKCFRICLFEKVISKPQHENGSGSIPGKFEPPNTLAAKKKTKTADRRHEIGHLFGLEDGDGGIMDKVFPKKGQHKDAHYGSKDHWGSDWCSKIKHHLGL